MNGSDCLGAYFVFHREHQTFDPNADLIGHLLCVLASDCVGLRPPSYQADDPPPYSIGDEEEAECDKGDARDVTTNDTGRRNSNQDDDKRPLHPLPTGNSSSAFDQRQRTAFSVACYRNMEDDNRRNRRKPDELLRGRHRPDERLYFGPSESPDVEDE